MGDVVKNIKSTLMIVSLIVFGIVGYVLHSRQQESQFLEFEGYQISSLEKKVADLYNEDKTDLSEDITEGLFTEINQLISEAQKKEYSGRNQLKLNETVEEFQTAKEMYTIQTEIHNVFEEDSEVVKRNLSKDTIEDLEERLEEFKNRTLFYSRNSKALTLAMNQVEEIEVASAFIEGLFIEGELREDLTPEEIEEAKELIDKIKNLKVKEQLLGELEGVEVVIAEEDEVEDEEEEELEEEIEVEEQDEVEVEVVRETEQEPERTPVREPESRPARQPAPEPTRPSNNTSRPSSPKEPERTPEPEPKEDSAPAPTPEPKVEIITERVPIKYQSIVTDFSDQLPRGQREVIREGVDGVKEITIERTTYPDGRVEEKKSEQVIKQSEAEWIREGILDPVG